jgi:hypothetical protein
LEQWTASSVPPRKENRAGTADDELKERLMKAVVFKAPHGLNVSHADQFNTALLDFLTD